MNGNRQAQPRLRDRTSGLNDLGKVHYNLGAAELYEESLRRGEAELTAHGALVA